MARNTRGVILRFLRHGRIFFRFSGKNSVQAHIREEVFSSWVFTTKLSTWASVVALFATAAVCSGLRMMAKQSTPTLAVTARMISLGMSERLFPNMALCIGTTHNLIRQNLISRTTASQAFSTCPKKRLRHRAAGEKGFIVWTKRCLRNRLGWFLILRPVLTFRCSPGSLRTKTGEMICRIAKRPPPKRWPPARPGRLLP